MITYKIILASLALIGLVLVGRSVTNNFSVGKPLIVNGHAVLIDGELVEFDGVTSPEMNDTCVTNSSAWPCGMLSAASLSKIIGERSVWCIERLRRTPRHVVSTCYMGVVDIAEKQVNAGWAQIIQRNVPKYVREQEHARRQSLGMWALSGFAPGK